MLLKYALFFTIDKEVELKRYPASAQGMVSSWVERFPDTNVDDLLEQLADAQAKYFEDLEPLAAA